MSIESWTVDARISSGVRLKKDSEFAFEEGERDVEGCWLATSEDAYAELASTGSRSGVESRPVPTSRSSSVTDSVPVC